MYRERQKQTGRQGTGERYRDRDIDRSMLRVGKGNVEIGVRRVRVVGKKGEGGG